MEKSVSRAFVFFVLLLASLSFAGDKPRKPAPVLPEFTGNWRLDPIHSNAHPTYLQANQIIIKQFGNQYQFEFRGGTKLLAREIYQADDREHSGYSTRLAKAFVSAKVDKGDLFVTTRSVLDPNGQQMYTETDRWSLSPDHQTLTNRMSDGKIRIYTKQPDEVETEVKDTDEDK